MARLEDYVAGPGEVVVGEETARLVSEAFILERLGGQRLKGLTRGLKAFRVKLDEKGAPGCLR